MKLMKLRKEGLRFLIFAALCLAVTLAAVCFVQEKSYAEGSGTINIEYRAYLEDSNGNLEPVKKPFEVYGYIDKLMPGSDVDLDRSFEGPCYANGKQLEVYGGYINMHPFNILGDGAPAKSYSVTGLPEGRYKINVGAKMSATSSDIEDASPDALFIDIAEGETKTVYAFSTYDKDRTRIFQLSNGSWVVAVMREPVNLKGDFEKLILAIQDATFDAEKKWEGEVTGGSVKVRLRWKFDVDEEVEALHKAITVKGVDEATIIEILSKYMQVNPEDRALLTSKLMDAYLAAKEKPLDEALRKGLLGHLETYILAILHNQDIYKIPQNVSVDENGYCYVDITFDKSENWKKTIENIILPRNFEVVELTNIPGSTMKWTYELKGNKITQHNRLDWVSDPNGYIYNPELGEYGYYNYEEVQVPDPKDPIAKVIVTNTCPPVDHKVTKKVNETQHIKITNRKDTFTYTIATNVPRKARSFTITDDMESALEFADPGGISVKIDGKDLPDGEKSSCLTVSGKSLKFAMNEEMVTKYGTLPILIAFKAKIADDADLSKYPDNKIPNIAVAKFDEEEYRSDSGSGTTVDISELNKSEPPCRPLGIPPVKEVKGIPNTGGTPFTGDRESLALWLMLLAGAGAMGLALKAKRRSK